jgi:hypothetical protein
MHLGHRAAHFYRLRLPHELGRQLRRADEIEQRMARVCAGDDDRRGDLLAARQLNPAHAVIVLQNRFHAGRRTHLPPRAFSALTNTSAMRPTPPSTR